MKKAKIVNRFISFDKKWTKWAKKIDKKRNLATDFVSVLIFGVVGILFYLLIYFFVLPQSIPLPQTTAVNWFVVHNHSLLLDYIRFAVFVTVIPITIIAGWFIKLWKKGK